MKLNVNGNTLKLLTGDITKQTTDAIVNAANGTLMGGGGVDGAIHKAAGSDLLAACKQVRQKELHGDYLGTGEAVITPGFRLPASYVIHTVGPIWDKNHAKQDEQLSNCYKNALELAKKHNLTSISFPSISTGIYRFPIDRAAKIALTTIKAYLEQHEFGYVAMVLFSGKDYHTYEQALKTLQNHQ